MLAPETPELLVLGCQSLDEGLLIHARPPYAVEEPSLQIVDASLYPRRPSSVKERAAHETRPDGVSGNARYPEPIRLSQPDEVDGARLERGHDRPALGQAQVGGGPRGDRGDERKAHVDDDTGGRRPRHDAHDGAGKIVA